MKSNLPTFVSRDGIIGHQAGDELGMSGFLSVATYQLQEVVNRTVAEIEQQRKEKDL